MYITLVDKNIIIILAESQINQLNCLNEITTNKVSSYEGFKFFYTNADQFVNKREDLLMMIADDRPHVILVTEVIPKNQINPINSALLDIEDYKPCFNFDPNDSNLGAAGYRGVAIYSKEDLGAVEVDIKVEGFIDHAWIEIPTIEGPLLVGCVYRSPSDDTSKDQSMISSKNVSKLIVTATKRNKNMIIAGDFNYKDIDWINEYVPPQKSHLVHFMETLKECYLYQHATEPTRYRKNEHLTCLI